MSTEGSGIGDFFLDKTGDSKEDSEEDDGNDDDSGGDEEEEEEEEKGEVERKSNKLKGKPSRTSEHSKAVSSAHDTTKDEQ